MSSPALAALAALPQAELKTIFESDPDRLSKLVLSHGPLRFDWSKTHLTDDLVDGFLKLAQEQDFAGRREALFAGEAVNNTEGRAASTRPSAASAMPTAWRWPRRCTIAPAR